MSVDHQCRIDKQFIPFFHVLGVYGWFDRGYAQGMAGYAMMGTKWIVIVILRDATEDIIL